MHETVLAASSILIDNSKLGQGRAAANAVALPHALFWFGTEKDWCTSFLAEWLGSGHSKGGTGSDTNIDCRPC